MSFVPSAPRRSISASKRLNHLQRLTRIQLSEDVYSAVDSGTTVSISADGKLLMDGFDPKSAVKIVGFNGSMSKSSGSGDIVGFAYSRDKQRIPLRVQKVHSVLGAPNDLLSVSALLQQG